MFAKPTNPKLQRSHPLAKGLVGAWLFNEIYGSKVYDHSGNSLTGTVASGGFGGTADTTRWTGGSFGSAISFDRSTGINVILGNPAQLNFTGPFSISVWCFPINIAGGSWTTLFEKGYDGSNEAYYFRFDAAGSLYRFGTYPGADHGVQIAITFSDIENKWNHCAGTFDGANWNLYLN